MLTVTAEELKRFAPRALPQLDGLNAAMVMADISTVERLCCFLGQIAHETQGFLYLNELWGPTTQQLRYERDFNAPWPSSPAESRLPAFAKNKLAYGLGNTQAGDGSLFRGHGDIQATGRYLHGRISQFLFGDDRLLRTPGLLATPEHAASSAAYFWRTGNLNRYVDAGDIDGLSDAINFGHKTEKVGDANGYADRVAKIKLARTIWN